MAGGSGTRFWPKSSKSKPKQLLALTGQKSQLQLTCSRLQGVVGKSNQLIVCTEALKKPTLKQIPGAWVLGEPEGRNTMAAVCWSAWTIFEEDPTALVAVLPADAFIADVPAFKKALEEGYRVAREEKRIVCLGIKPTFPATAYGYIQKGSALKTAGFEIKRFIEKPDLNNARDLFASQEFLWNAGIFIFSIETFLSEVRSHAPEFAAFFDSRSENKIKKDYKKLPSIAIDVALMEKTSRGALISGDFGWNDLGSWPALAEVLPSNSEAGVIKAPGGFLSLGSKKIIADMNSKKFLALIGVENLIIVETENALMVCHGDHAQDIKTLVQQMQKNKKLAQRLL
jgi:mannose-1-phosphate guanylyltransferase